MTTTVSSLIVEISGDVAGLQRSLGQADRGVQGFVTNVGRAATGLGVKMTAGVTLPLLAAGNSALDAAADFETAMAEISARTGLVGPELMEIQELALQLGADTVFSAQQAADAFLQLLSSGQSTSEAIATIPHILTAAAASGEDLGRTADVITDIMASFNLEVGDAAGVVNALAQAAGASSADMSSLGEGFANVGGVAKSFGLDVSQTAAILAIFAENGIKGAEAGTQLKSMLLNMTRTTEDTVGAWETLGTSFYDATGNVRPLEEVIADLDVALDELPLEEQHALMKDLGGSYGILGLTALRGSISIGEMQDRMSEQAEASAVAEARMNTFRGATDSFAGSMQSLAINVMMPFMQDTLTPFIQQMTEGVNAVTEWSERNPELARTVLLVAGGLAVAGPMLIALGTAITLAAPAIGLLAGAFALLVSPIGLAVAGIAGLVALLANSGIDFGALGNQIKTEIDGVLSSINFDGTALLNRIKTEIDTAAGSFNFDGTALLSRIRTEIDTAAGSFSFDATAVANTVQTGITNSFSTMDFSGVRPFIDTHFNEILGTIISVAGIVFGGPIGLAIGGAKLVATAIENDFLGIGTFLNTSGISESVTTALNDVKTLIDNLISSVFSGGAGGGAAGPSGGQWGMAGVMEGFAGGGGAGMSGPLGTFVNDLQMGLNFLRDTVDNIWNNLAPGLQSMGDGIKGFIENLSGAETDGLLRVFTVITGAIGGFASKMLELGSEVVGTAMTEIGNALPSFGSAIADLITIISDMGEGNWDEIGTGVGNFFTNIGEGLLNLAGIDIQLPDFATSIETWRTNFEMLPTIISGIIDRVRGAFADLSLSVRAGIRDLEQTVMEVAGNVAAAGEIVGMDFGVQGVAGQLAGSLEAEKLEQQVQAYLAGNPIAIDPGLINFQLNGVSAEQTQKFVDSIIDPMAIQEAMNLALAGGDMASFDALVPLALQLDIDPQLLVNDYNAAIAAAAAAQTFSASVTADITVNPGHVDMSPVAAAVAVGGAGGRSGPSLSSGVPALATGGYIKGDGLAYLHAGEVVLNDRQQKNSGQGGGVQNNTIIIQGAQNVDQILAELNRRGIQLQPG